LVQTSGGAKKIQGKVAAWKNPKSPISRKKSKRTASVRFSNLNEANMQREATKGKVMPK
jgi:hypothetical protein